MATRCSRDDVDLSVRTQTSPVHISQPAPHSPVTHSKNLALTYDDADSRPAKNTRQALRYQSGRFLFDEPSRLAERNIRIDIKGLEYEVSKCMGCASVVSTCLYHEGNTSRLLQMVLEDRRKVIVKIPYRPRPVHYATASEVATLTFLRSNGVPVPKVCGWSSSASDSKAGVEYLVMERANGRKAADRFGKMNQSCFKRMVNSFIDVEKHLFSLEFATYGSIYFTEDVPPQHRRPLFKTITPDKTRASSRYCIGPTTEPIFWIGAGENVTPDHGPWDTSSAYLKSLGNQVLDIVSNLTDSTPNKFPLNSMFGDTTSPEDYVELLKGYLDACPFLLNRCYDSSLHTPVLRHPVLSARNLFLCPSTDTILTITNWRFASVLPSAATAGFPHLFDTLSTSSYTLDVMPNLPVDFEFLSPADQTKAKSVYQSQLLFHLYGSSTKTRNRAHTKILESLPATLIRKLLRALKQPWTGIRNMIILRRALITLAQRWSELPVDRPCPLEFARYQIEAQAQDEAMLADAEELVSYIKQEVGVDDSGWVSHERYEHAKKRNRELKQEWMLQAANSVEERQIDQGWMFQDTA